MATVKKPDFFTQLRDVMALSDSLVQRAAGTSSMGIPGAGPMPTPQPQSTPNDGDPLDKYFGGGGTGGGQSQPSAPTGGGIKGPDFSGDQGLYGSGKVPPGYEPIGPLAPEYFYNPQSGEVGSYTGGGLDAYGQPQFGFNTLSETERKRFLKGLGIDLPGAAGSGSQFDPLGPAKLAEAIRAQRIQEAQAAINTYAHGVDQAQSDKLSALPYAVGDMTHYPGLGPNSPVVKYGLADPFKIPGVAFDPERAARAGSDQEQIQKDLATLRSLAGY